jgi:GNAT superfamily N-acetyltransferase
MEDIRYEIVRADDPEYVRFVNSLRVDLPAEVVKELGKITYPKRIAPARVVLAKRARWFRDEIVGCATISRSTDVRAESEIRDIIVHSEYRGKGIGSGLFVVAANHLFSIGAVPMYCIIRNTKALSFPGKCLEIVQKCLIAEDGTGGGAFDMVLDRW